MFIIQEKYQSIIFFIKLRKPSCDDCFIPGNCNQSFPPNIVEPPPTLNFFQHPRKRMRRGDGNKKLSCFTFPNCIKPFYCNMTDQHFKKKKSALIEKFNWFLFQRTTWSVLGAGKVWINSSSTLKKILLTEYQDNV